MDDVLPTVMGGVHGIAFRVGKVKGSVAQNRCIWTKELYCRPHRDTVFHRQCKAAAGLPRPHNCQKSMRSPIRAGSRFLNIVPSEIEARGEVAVTHSVELGDKGCNVPP